MRNLWLAIILLGVSVIAQATLNLLQMSDLRALRVRVTVLEALVEPRVTP